MDIFIEKTLLFFPFLEGFLQYLVNIYETNSLFVIISGLLIGFINIILSWYVLYIAISRIQIDLTDKLGVIYILLSITIFFIGIFLIYSFGIDLYKTS